MFSLSIMVGSGQWRLLFKSEEAAQGASKFFQEQPESALLTLLDDYGQRATFRMSSIHAVMLEDMQQSKLASVAMALHEARVRNEAMKAAQTDPQLRAAQMNQGPSVITPMGARF